MNQYPHAIVLGGSSGIGAELVKQLANNGSRVLAVGRDAERLEAVRLTNPAQIEVLIQDLAEFASASRVNVARMAERIGGLDLIIYAAGIMPPVRIDEFDGGSDVTTITLNFTAAVAWLDEAATRFQAVGTGTIIGIGSVAGDRGRLGYPAYNSSKAGFHAYLEALRNRLTRKGVTVVTIKPGPVDTPMTAHLQLKGMMAPEVAAQKILAVSSRPGEHYLKLTHRVIFAVIRIVPSWIFRKLNI